MLDHTIGMVRVTASDTIHILILDMILDVKNCGKLKITESYVILYKNKDRSKFILFISIPALPPSPAVPLNTAMAKNPAGKKTNPNPKPWKPAAAKKDGKAKKETEQETAAQAGDLVYVLVLFNPYTTYILLVGPQN